VVVREHDSPSIEHAVADDPDERRYHDRVCSYGFVECIHACRCVVVLRYESCDDVRADVTRSRLRSRAGLEFLGPLRRLRANERSSHEARYPRQSRPDRAALALQRIVHRLEHHPIGGDQVLEALSHAPLRGRRTPVELLGCQCAEG
jgi:hypothetical protein